MSEPASPPPVRQIGSLTAIRGIAAWWVVLYHFRAQVPLTGPPARRMLAHGYLAVDLFFILSGFVIALNYSAGFARLTGAGYRRFLALRLARIYPLHLVMMLLFLTSPLAIVLFSHSGVPGARYDPLYYILSLLLVQNWGFVDHLAWNVPAWSISTEWAAYLLFPLLAWAIAPRLRHPAGAVAFVAGALAVLAAGAALAVPSLGADPPTFGLFRCLTEFAAGAGLFWFARLRPVRASGRDGSVALAGAAMLAAAAALCPLPDFVLVPPAFALLVYGLAREPSWAAWLLDRRALRAIGAVSYSTYLAHDLIREWVKFLLVRPGEPSVLALAVYLGATAVASAALYRIVEVPGRRFLRAALAGSTAGGGRAARIDTAPS